MWTTRWPAPFRSLPPKRQLPVDGLDLAERRQLARVELSLPVAGQVGDAQPVHLEERPRLLMRRPRPNAPPAPVMLHDSGSGSSVPVGAPVLHRAISRRRVVVPFASGHRRRLAIAVVAPFPHRPAATGAEEERACEDEDHRELQHLASPFVKSWCRQVHQQVARQPGPSAMFPAPCLEKRSFPNRTGPGRACCPASQGARLTAALEDWPRLRSSSWTHGSLRSQEALRGGRMRRPEHPEPRVPSRTPAQTVQQRGPSGRSPRRAHRGGGSPRGGDAASARSGLQRPPHLAKPGDSERLELLATPRGSRSLFVIDPGSALPPRDLGVALPQCGADRNRACRAGCASLP